MLLENLIVFMLGIVFAAYCPGLVAKVRRKIESLFNTDKDNCDH